MLKTESWRIPQKLLVTFTSLLLLSGSGLTSETASQAHELPVSAVLRDREFASGSELQFSPDGKWIAYAINELPKTHPADTETWLRTGVPWYGRGGRIYIVNIKTGESEQLTSPEGSNWLPTWSRDGRYLAFLSDRDGSDQSKVWIWDALSNSLRKTCDVSVRGDWIEWMLDNRSVLVTTVPLQFNIDTYLNRVLRSAASRGVPARGHPASSTATIYESGGDGFRPDFRAMPDPWNLDEKLRDLTSIDIKNGKTTTIVRDRRIAAFLLSPDGSQVAYTSPTHFERPGSQQIDFELRVVAMGSSEDRVVASDIRLEFGGRAFSWSPDGTRLSFRRGGDEETAGDCYVVDLRQQGTRNVSTLPPDHSRSSLSGTKPLWGKDGSEIYFVRDGNLWRALVDQAGATLVTEIPDHQIRELISTGENVLWTEGGGTSTIVLTHDSAKKQDGFYRVDLRTGQSSKLLERGQCYSCISQSQHVAVSNDGRKLAYLAEDAQQCSDLWVTEWDFQQPRRLTHINPQLDDYEMGKAELIDWLSDDGELLHGALLLPSHYRKGKRYPLIVWVYGGNWLSDHFDHFGLASGGPFNMQLLATRGYAVLAPDAPQHVGTPMSDLAKSVLPGVNKTIELGIVDPDRIGVMGHSNGGYSTVALIVQTNRFKAGMEISGTADLWSLYGEMGEDGTAFGVSILEHGQDAMGGTPWEFRERYIENSPAFYLDRVETPLLMIQGSEDTAVAPFLGDQLFIALRRLGKEVAYAKYQGEEHSPANWSYVNQVDLCERMIAWFDTHLKKLER